jgi:Protein of unknown function (DUF3131)
LQFGQGLLRARSHIVFILALVVGFPTMIWLDRLGSAPDGARRGAALPVFERPETAPHLAGRASLRPDQMEWGRIAWRYFERNIVPATGLANSADGFPSTTMWDTGSFLLGMMAARQIGIIDNATFDARMGLALASLAKLPLFEGVLPNKAYNTQTLSMVDYNNKPTDRGLGWSALDIARVLVPLMILQRTDDVHASAARKVIEGWHLEDLTDAGMLIGATVNSQGGVDRHQEGRIGYEQYAAHALIAFGQDAFSAWRTDENMEVREVAGVKVPYDNRSADKFGAQVYATSEPYILAGLEFGFDERTGKFADAIYLAQLRRFEATGILTAVSEGHLDRRPYFVYATVLGNDVAWSVLTDKGERIDDARTVSTKVSFAYDAIYETDYTKKLVESVVSLNNPIGGWLEGRYEANDAANAAETSNTNAIVLESLSYKAFGPLLLQKRRDSG